MATTSVHALSSGHFTLPESLLIAPVEPTDVRTIPSLSFLIQHKSQKGALRVVFDLGLRREIEQYPEALQARLRLRKPLRTVPCVVDSLKAGGLTPDDIDVVVLSHVHFDHIGTPWHFRKSSFIVGPGTLGLIDGTIKLSGAQHNFEDVGLPVERTIELPHLDPGEDTHSCDKTPLSLLPVSTGPWQSLGPFPHAIDFFQDQSFFIVSAPGHVPGHIIVITRTSTEPLRWVLLAGDAFHDQMLLDGTKIFGTWTDPGLGCVTCLHADPDVAMDTIAKIRTVRDEGLLGGKVEIVYAHDVQWAKYAEANGRMWPGEL